MNTDALTRWRNNVRLSPVDPNTDRHSIHTYFNTCPENSDSQWVLFFASVDPESHIGDVCIRHRVSGEERILARNIITEDAHRVACQQWICGGNTVVFHACENDIWRIVAVDIESGASRILRENRQLAWGSGDVVPLYGPHWELKAYRDLELLNVRTGEAHTVLTVDAVLDVYGDWIETHFGTREIAIFFPALSPNGNRVFFKLSAPQGLHFRSKQASNREGIFCYDLKAERFTFMHKRWGHPAWHPDSRGLINTPNVLIDSDTGDRCAIPNLPDFPGSHPAISPDGDLFVTDVRYKPSRAEQNPWGIVVAPLEGEDHIMLHRFENAGGASSWRPPHPHPIFSTDGRRIYFNVNEGPWTRLHVADASLP